MPGDNINRQIIDRWRLPDLLPSDIMIFAGREGRCTCQTCLRVHYEDCIAEVPSQPHGDSCDCEVCKDWRRRLVRLLGYPAVPDLIPVVPRNRDIELRPPSDYTFAIDTPSLTEEVVRQDAFARTRERRGHPLPKLKIAADWQPNQWEA